MLPVKKTSSSFGEKNTDPKNNTDNPIQPGNGETGQELTIKSRSSASSIATSSSSFSEAVAKETSSSTPSTAKKSIEGFLGAAEYNPNQTQGQTLASSSQPSRSRNMQAFVNTIEYRPTYLQTPAPDYSSSLEATSSEPPAELPVTEEWDPQTIAQKIPTLARDTQLKTTLDQIYAIIARDANFSKFYYPAEIGNILKALIDLKNALVTNRILVALKPHIAKQCNEFRIEIIRLLLSCLKPLNDVDIWKISITLLPRITALTRSRQVNERNCLSLNHISGSLQGLMGVAHLGPTKHTDIEILVAELLRHLKYHQSNQNVSADKRSLNKTSIVLTTSVLNGIPNPPDSAIDKLLNYLASRIKIEANSLTFKEIAYILRGLEGKYSSNAVKEILATISTISFAELTEISGINIALAIGGLRTLANLAEAQKLISPLLQLSQTNQITTKGNMLTLLYGLASYRESPEILSLANDKNKPLVTSELTSMFQGGLAALDNILPYLASLRTSKPGSNYVSGHGYINLIQLDLHDSEHSLARALCLYTLESVFLTEQTYTELRIIIGQSNNQERNTGTMLAIAQSALVSFSASVNAVLSDTNQGLLIVTRKQEPSANSSSAPTGENT